MKTLLSAAVILFSSLHAQTLELPNSVEPSIPDSWKEKPPQIQVDLGDLKIGPIGYRIESTDFEADPNRQLVVILDGNGVGFDIVEIKGRYSNQKEIEEWAVYYHDGEPLLAQWKKWKKISIDGDELGEGLSKVETFLARDGKFTIHGDDEAKRIVDMIAFAEKARAEQGGADQPATAPESTPEGNEKPKPQSEVRSQ
jgi:hypothetical protein|tara:strand:- start:1590 stop:2183 length:594 start_codon:yes stop_codon:yes gene_type:complete